MSNNPIKDTPISGQVVVENGRLISQLQSLLESIDFVLNTGKVNAYAMANLPDATKSIESSIIITDHPDGYSLAISNGSAWIIVGTGTTSAAINVTNTPAGNISSTNVQAALNELDAGQTLDDSSLIVAHTTDLQTFADDIDHAVLKTRGTGVDRTYVASVPFGGTTFDMPDIFGEIKSDQGYFDIHYTGTSGITVSDLTAESTYVYINKDGALQQQITTPTRQERTRNIFLIRIAVNTVSNTIIGFEYSNNPIVNVINSLRDVYDFLLAQGVPFKKDMVVTGRATDLGFDVSAGQILEFGGTGDIYNPNIKSFSLVSQASFILVERTTIASSTTTVIPKFWDNNGVLTALGSTTWVGHRLVRFSNGAFAMQYGQGNYANLVLAKAGVLTEDYVLNPRIKNSTFLGWWFIESVATNTGNTGATITTAFVEYALGIQGGVSSGLSGALLVGNNLSDVLDAAASRTSLGVTSAASPIFSGGITQSSLSADPSDPSTGNSVQWLSDGSGSGDAGDVMVKINVGGTTKTATLIDYSAI
jgi:hypothetical protein